MLYVTPMSILGSNLYLIIKMYLIRAAANHLSVGLFSIAKKYQDGLILQYTSQRALLGIFEPAQWMCEQAGPN